MQNIKRFFTLTICFSILWTTGISQAKFVNEFLNIGVGARSHGMFGSVVASTEDITAGYWNPAGLAYVETDFQAAGMHASWFGGIANYDYIGIGKKMGGFNNSGFGSFTLIRMGIDNIPNTLNLIGPDGSINYDDVTEFSAADYAFLFSYSKPLFETDISFGASAKIIHRSVGGFGNAWGFGLDIGAMLKKEHLRFGLMLRDITTTVNAWNFNLTSAQQAIFLQTGNEIPTSRTEIALPKIVLGAAYYGGGDTFSYLAEADVRFSTDGTLSGVFSGNRIGIDPSLGVELGYNKLVFLRFGIGNIQRTINEINADSKSVSVQPNLGLGLALGRLKVDYALTNIGSVSGVLVSHIFSLTLDFNAN